MRRLMPICSVFLFLFVCQSLFILSSVRYSFGFEYESEKRAKEKQREIDDLKARIGKQYWILPNTYIKFYDRPDILSDNFSLTEATAFFVKEWIPSAYIVSKYSSHYKVVFESSKVAYIQATTLDEDNYWFKKYISISTNVSASVSAKLKQVEDNLSKEEERVKQENERLKKEYEQENERVRRKEEKEKQEKAEKLDALIKQKIGQKLPPNYKGHDFQKTYTKYFETLLGKGEFEKSDVYEKRLHSINLDEVYAFAITDKDTLEITYDPDKEVVDIEIKPLSAYRFLPKTDGDNSIWPFIILKTTKKKVSSYVGSNAFGAKKVIKKYEANKYGVQVEKNNSVSFSMPIREAKKYKDNMSILLICKPQIKNDVLAFIGSYYSEPTFDNPVEISYGVLGLNMELLSIWVYDSKTGKIHYKQHMEQN